MLMSVPMTNGTSAQSTLNVLTSREPSTVNVKLVMRVMVLFVMMSMNVIKVLIIVIRMLIALIPLVLLNVHVILDMKVTV